MNMFLTNTRYFVAHPVSLRKMTFREFDIAHEYINEKREVEKRNRMLLRKNPNATPKDVPKIPRFTGDPDEDYSNIIREVEVFLNQTELAFRDPNDTIDMDSDYDEFPSDNEASSSMNHENNELENEPDVIILEDSHDQNETFNYEDLTIDDDSRSSLSPERDPTYRYSYVNPSSDVEMTLIFSFNDICINLVNGEECDDVYCDSKHAFPTRKELLKKLKNHTKQQVDEAFKLVLKSKALRTRYLEIFHSIFNKSKKAEE